MAINTDKAIEENFEKIDFELLEKVEKLIESKKVDKTTIAKGINRSDAAICQYLMKKYPGNVEKLQEELRNYVQLFERRESIDIKSLSFVETSVVQKIFAVANLCQLRGKMGVCYGAPGIGKSTAIAEYQKISSGVIVVDPFEHTSAKAVLQQMAEQLKLNYFNNMSIDILTGLVIKKLEKNPQLIILDEAENLKIDIFKIIRKIHDRTKNNCGVLFVGTHDLSMLLHRVKSGFPYISSRIGYIERLDAVGLKDVEKFVYQYFPNCNNKLVSLIAKSTNYNSRCIQNLLDICYDIVKSNDIELNTDVIETAREKLLI